MSRGVLGRLGIVGVVVAGLVLAGCGGSAASRNGPQGRKVNRLDPVNPRAAKEFEAAMRALRLGGPAANETAKVRLAAALEIDPKLWEAWHDLGVIHYKDGEDGEAITAFGKALGITAGHTPTLLARAEAHRRANHKKDARSDYEAALRGIDEDDPNRRDAAARLASLLRDAGDYDDAVAVLRETVRVSGVSARIYTELGLIYIQQKRFELANLVLAKAVELDTAEQKDAAIYNALALLALRQGRAQEAFERFDYAASLDATYLDARFNKASVLLDAGDYARAKVELAAIVEKRADDYAARVALGVAHRGLKEHKEAATTWDRVIKEAPRRGTPRADAMFNVALLKVDFLEDPAGGKADLDRYLQEAPSSHSKRQAAEEKRKELGK
ncbi:MAG: tetratricopeptide repeat protein [Deltaproteobacteria bacterium]|nr:tetratricopeptide repeat protein [Deltaproteobacteria bacterium]